MPLSMLWLLHLSCVNWQHFLAKMSATAKDYLLALATLSDTPKNGNDQGGQRQVMMCRFH
jgi:hypothetical protein